MALLADLLSRLPQTKEVRMSAQGYALWISWGQELDPAVPQTLQNYGGMFIAQERNQSLWFFFSTDVFLALARLSVWARFHPLPVTIVHMPAKLLFGVKREISMTIDSGFMGQEVLSGENLDLWVHPKTHEKELTIPGIVFEPKNPKQGLVVANWTTIVADTRLPYTSTHGWYGVIHPLGNPLDKNFQSGWDNMYACLEPILQQHKLRFMLHDNFVMISLDNLRLLRECLRDWLGKCAQIKQEQHENYWPCVSVVIDRKGMNFNMDLYKKVGLQWDKLMPDFPYMSYRNAYLLGSGFAVQDLHFSSNQTSMDSWCNVALDEGSVQHQAIPLLMAEQLSTGENICCFYCGMPSHQAYECPSIQMPPADNDVWKDLASMSLDNINESFRHIEATLTNDGLAGYKSIFDKADSEARLLDAIFEINSIGQLRKVEHLWLTRGRDLVKTSANMQPVTQDDSPSWDMLDKLREVSADDLAKLDKNIQTAVARNPRDGRLRSVQGFLAIHRQEYEKALACFKEAAMLTSSPPLQSWNEYLQARLAETQGQLGSAIEQYEQLHRMLPTWTELLYRQLVCKVKLGFAEQILQQLHELIADDPNYFNRCLIDPELGRGQLLILTSLNPLWESAKRNIEEEKTHLQNLANQIAAWFAKDHPVNQHLSKELDELKRLSNVGNYVAMLQVESRRPVLEKETNDRIQHEIEALQSHFKQYLAILQEIRDEAAWFPFPKILHNFSKEFNEAASIINWAFASNFHDADTFKKAQETTKELDSLLRGLRRRLKFLRIVRDATLFTLTLGKTFFWIEIVGILLCFLGVPGIVLYGDSIGMGWLKNILASQQWEIQKVLVLVISLLALGLAALRTTIVFDKKRDKLIEEARNQREEMQNMRLERIRRQREAEAEALAREKQKENERIQRQRMQGYD